MTALAACSGGGKEPTATPSSTGGTPVPVELSSFAYSPKQVTVKAGQPVTFRLRSKDIEHTFTVKDLGIDWTVPTGGANTQNFTFQKTGEFRIVCTVAGHEAAGMVGTLIVRS